jgi:hypothetical protein
LRSLKTSNEAVNVVHKKEVAKDTGQNDKNPRVTAGFLTISGVSGA